MNTLRNIALHYANTDLTLITDADLIPSPNLYATLNVRFDDGSCSHFVNTQSVYTQTGFAGALSSCPRLKLITLWTVPRNCHNRRLNCLISFIQEKCGHFAQKNGHEANERQTTRTGLLPGLITQLILCIWEENLYIPQVSYEQDFEPYLVIDKRSAPDFDERFVGFGWNKAQYTMHLDALGCVLFITLASFSLPSVTISLFCQAPG